jgi:hypothetical protein
MAGGLVCFLFRQTTQLPTLDAKYPHEMTSVVNLVIDLQASGSELARGSGDQSARVTFNISCSFFIFFANEGCL